MPLVTEISEALKPTGTSLKVKVRVRLSPVMAAVLLLVMTTVGAVVSKVYRMLYSALLASVEVFITLAIMLLSVPTSSEKPLRLKLVLPTEAVAEDQFKPPSAERYTVSLLPNASLKVPLMVWLVVLVILSVGLLPVSDDISNWVMVLDSAVAVASTVKVLLDTEDTLPATSTVYNL